MTLQDLKSEGKAILDGTAEISGLMLTFALHMSTYQKVYTKGGKAFDAQSVLKDCGFSDKSDPILSNVMRTYRSVLTLQENRLTEKQIQSFSARNIQYFTTYSDVVKDDPKKRTEYVKVMRQPADKAKETFDAGLFGKPKNASRGKGKVSKQVEKPSKTTSDAPDYKSAHRWVTYTVGRVSDDSITTGEVTNLITLAKMIIPAIDSLAEDVKKPKVEAKKTKKVAKKVA